MNTVTKIRLSKESASPGVHLRVGVAIYRWLQQPQTMRFKHIETSIAVVDDADIIESMRETSDVVLLISGQPETVPKDVEVCTPETIEQVLFKALMKLEPALKV